MEESSKRRRIQAADRLDDIPDYLLQDIMSHLGSRQVVQTSALSRRWTHLWHDVLHANVTLDEREFAADEWECFEDFADHVLSMIPPQKKLDVFRLNLISTRGFQGGSGFAATNRWIRRGLRRCPAAVDIRTAQEGTVWWHPHFSYITGTRQQSDLSSATRRLRKICLVGVGLGPGSMEDLGTYFPALEDLRVERCRLESFRPIIVSTALTSLVLVESEGFRACRHLWIAAPRLAHLRIHIAYDGRHCNCATASGLKPWPDVPSPMASLAEASIRLTDTSFHGQPYQRAGNKGKLEVFKIMRRFLALLPNVIKLHLHGFNTTALLEEESQEFPLFHSLKTLTLQSCDLGAELQAVACILCNTPRLEKLALHHCTFLDPPPKKRKKMDQKHSKSHSSTTASGLWCQKLKSIEFKGRQQDETHFDNVLSKVSERLQTEQNLSSTIVFV